MPIGQRVDKTHRMVYAGFEVTIMFVADVKNALVGCVIEDVGLTNRAGEKCVRLKLSNTEIPLLVPLSDVIVTASSRKPMGRSLTALPNQATMKVG